MSYDYDDFLSVFTWRYGSPEMRGIFSEKNTRLGWRRFWVALARAQKEFGIVNEAELKDIEAHVNDVDVEASLEKEKEIRHDLMAEVLVYSSQCKVGGGKIHLGATSMDVEDNADVLRQKQAIALLKKRLAGVLSALSALIKKYSDTPCMGYTHLQTAEPTTLGYRFANYAQDLLADLRDLNELEKSLKGKGVKGAVGTQASYQALVGDAAKLESLVLKGLGLDCFDAATQVYPRKQDYLVASVLAGVAMSLHRMAFDVRVLQSSMYGEESEPFKQKQVGSSAMPFKRNPMTCERICSLARLVSSYPEVAWSNAANSLLERTLDDSANRRVFLPEAFLAVDECLLLANRVFSGLQVNDAAVKRNLAAYGAFSCTEPLLMELVKQGKDRQKMHELIRVKSMEAWQAVQDGKKNPLKALLLAEKDVADAVSANRMDELFDAGKHTGTAGKRALLVAGKVDHAINGISVEKAEAKF